MFHLVAKITKEGTANMGLYICYATLEVGHKRDLHSFQFVSVKSIFYIIITAAVKELLWLIISYIHMKGIEMLIFMLDNRACHSHVEYWSSCKLFAFSLKVAAGILR